MSDLRERLRKKQRACTPSKEEIRLAEVMRGIVDELAASLPGMLRKEALAELEYRVNYLARHECGDPAVPQSPSFDTKAIEAACEKLKYEFQGMTRQLALGQIRYDLGQAWRRA